MFGHFTNLRRPKCRVICQVKVEQISFYKTFLIKTLLCLIVLCALSSETFCPDHGANCHNPRDKLSHAVYSAKILIMTKIIRYSMYI